MVTAFEQGHAKQQHRRHATGGTHTGLGTFEGGQSHFHAGNCRVGKSRIDVAIFLASKTTCSGFAVWLHKARGQVQRFGVFAVLRFLDSSSHGQGIKMQMGG